MFFGIEDKEFLDLLSKIDMSVLADCTALHTDKEALLKPAGIEPYRLLSFFSNMFCNYKIADIGSRTGTSGIALSMNPKNTVHSYDISRSSVWDSIKRENLSFYVENLLENLPKLLDYHMIYLDVDPHDGIKEKTIIDYLSENSYSGWVVMDDIGKEWPDLHNYWNSIEARARSRIYSKHDLTVFGHCSGTGLLIFGDWV